MRRIFRILAIAFVASGLVAGTATSGPIRDLIRQKLGRAPANVTLQAGVMELQGLRREYFIYVPASVQGKSGAPLVFVFHGGQGDGSDAAQSSQMAAAAEALGFIAIFPSSYENQWNDGRNATASNIDDVGYVKALIKMAVDTYGADSSRVFAAGISNGGIFTQRLVCDAAKTFRAVGVVVANMPADYQGLCRPARPVPMIFFNGTADGLMPWEGGEIKSSKLLGMGAGGTVLSHDATEAFWAGVNGCGPATETRPLPDTAKDKTTVSVRDYPSCGGGTSMSFFLIEGGGHNWPGSSTRSSRIAGNVSQDISATVEMVAFFSAYGL